MITWALSLVLSPFSLPFFLLLCIFVGSGFPACTVPAFVIQMDVKTDGLAYATVVTVLKSFSLAHLAG
jgi:hypothetical protein